MKKFLKKLSIIILVLITIICVFFVTKKIIRLEKILNNKNNTEWIITQFGSNDGGQMMCFTIEGNKDGLIIIDGGYKDNEEQYSFLMEKISKHNNTVDCWIITHFDPDHGGEFIRIVNDKNIDIKKVYVPDTPTDMETLVENAPYEDDWSIYEEYLSLELPQKIKVHIGDEFEFIGLKMKVLCSYEDWVDEKCENLLNNGSMVFKLYGNKESFLFCGDTQSLTIAKYLLDNCKSELKSDYLQVAHHGNNYFGEEFYKAVSPKVAFFSAPDCLMENRENVSWFTVEKNRATLEELGAKILWYNTSPNEQIFK